MLVEVWSNEVAGFSCLVNTDHIVIVEKSGDSSVDMYFSDGQTVSVVLTNHLRTVLRLMIGGSTAFFDKQDTEDEASGCDS